MFTGIIEGLGTLSGIRSAGAGLRLAVTADFPLEGAKIGDSLAVNGACLTAVSISGSRFEVDVSPETVEKTTFKFAAVGQKVNIERALRLSDRLDGHLVSGHVDGMGRITHQTRRANAILVGVALPGHLARYLIPKGSVAVDGVSLTINQCDNAGFEVSIIPHTAAMTAIGRKSPGDPVNIETDMIGKYVEKLLTSGRADATETSGKPIDMAYLLKTGFL